MHTDDNDTIGNYKLVNCIASGNSCQVWEVTEIGTTRRLALKMLLTERLKDAEIVAAVKNEFNVAKTFDHPNILRYHELSVTKKHAYFTMDLFNAPSVKAQIYNDIRSVHMRLKKLIELVSMALEHIHERGYLHRDIKPDNILMNKSAEVRVIDFSLSSKAAGTLGKMLHRKQSTVQGTRTYMAPEQIMGKPLTVQTDIYNFGITLFEMLTGQPPFKGSTPKDLLLRHISEPVPAPSLFNANVTPQMDAVVQRMLAKKPEMRHKKMAEFMAEFRNTPLFKEEVTEKVELTAREKAEQELSQNLGERLDSRKDAMRKEFGVAAPPPKKKKAPVPPPKPAAQATPQSSAMQGQGGRPGAQPFVPQMPMAGAQPMMPMPPGYMPGQMMPGQMMPGQMMPGQMMPGQMPMAPYPMMQMPQGPAPWVMQPAPMPGGQMPAGPAPGMPGGPWMQPQQQPPMMPPGALPAPGRPPVPVPLPPPAAIPAPPLPPPAVAVQPQPVVPKPAPPAPVKAPAAKPAVAPKPGEGFNIGDMAGFDELPPVS